MGIRELGEFLGVSPQTIRGNRDHPLYSKALKLGGPTSPLKWRREDVDATSTASDVASANLWLMVSPQQECRAAS